MIESVIQNNSLRYLTQAEAEEVKEFLLKTPLERPIYLEFPQLDLQIQVEEITEGEWEAVYDSMYTSVLKGPNGVDDGLVLNGKRGYLHLHIGRWNDSARLDACHIVLGSDRMNDDRFGQLELGSCLTDGQTVYLVKNLTRHGGDGAIVRLNSRADRQTQVWRRQRLVDALQPASMIEFEGMEHLVIADLSLRMLREDPEPLFWRAMQRFLRYAGEVECLRRQFRPEDEPIRIDRASGGPRYIVDPATRREIEEAGMQAARDWLEEQDYTVSDVAADYIGCDLIGRSGSEELWVEVKATTRENWGVELTEQEYQRARERRERYVLLVVVLRSTDRLTVERLVPLFDPTDHHGCVLRPVRYLVTESQTGWK